MKARIPLKPESSEDPPAMGRAREEEVRREGEGEALKDPDLAAWVREDSPEEMELIVEARLPERKVGFREDAKLGPRPREVLASDPGNRVETLKLLDAVLREKLRRPTTLLKAAGAIVVRATSAEVRALADHPLIKSIRLNRRLQPPPVRGA